MARVCWQNLPQTPPTITANRVFNNNFLDKTDTDILQWAWSFKDYVSTLVHLIAK